LGNGTTEAAWMDQAYRNLQGRASITPIMSGSSSSMAFWIFLLTTEGSCSTGLLMTQGKGMLGLATFQGPLPIEEEAQEGGCRLEGNCNLGSGCPRMALQSKEATC